MYETLEYRIQDQTAVITLNMPHTYNALDEQSGPELVRALETAATDEAVRAVILTGVGKAFSAGGNVQLMYKYLSEHPDQGASPLFDGIVDNLNRSVLLMRRMPKPVIAAVNGVAAGGGLGWVLAADMVLAAPHARFDTAYIRISVSPDGGNAFFLPRLLGPWKAAELLMRGKALTAEEARNLGLVSRIIEADFLLDEALALAAELARMSAPALARTKELINTSLDSNLEQTLELEKKYLLASVDEGDFRTSINAFFDKKR